MEILDIYNNEGKLTGKTIVRGEPTDLNEDEHFAVAVIFLENSKGKFLIQKTSEEKGGKYATTGGHVNHGETPKECIIREVKEELNISLNEDEIQELGYIIYDLPIRYIFYAKKDIDLKEINLQEEEVENIEYLSIQKIKELIENKEFLDSHGIQFDYLLKKLNK